MNINFLGEGEYAYECKEPDCWFCEMMGLKPPVFTNVPRKQPEVFIIPMAANHHREDEVILPVNSDLSKYQRRKLREMGLPTHRIANFKLRAYR